MKQGCSSARRGRRAGFVWPIGLLAALPAPAAWSAEWGLDPSVTVSARHDDNLFLGTNTQDAVSSLVVSPRLDVGAREAHWELRGGALLRSARYSENGLDTNDHVFDIKSRLLGERSQWALDATQARETIATNDTIDPDTGLAQAQTQRLTQMATPSLTYSLSPRDQFTVSYQFQGVRYKDQPVANTLLDYRQDTTTLQWSRQQTERAQFFVTGYVADFSLDNDRYGSKTTGLQAGVNYRYSETTDVTLALGARRTTVDQIVTVCTLEIAGICLATADELRHSRDSGFLANASLIKRFELTRLQIELSENITPSGSGSQVDTLSGVLKLERPVFSPNSGLRFSATALRSRSIGEDVSGNDRYLVRVEPGGYWRFSESWTLHMDYRYTRQRYENTPSEASGNSVILSLHYRPNRIILP